MISFFDLFYFLNATLVWHVATALCNIQQHEDWENDNCLDVIMCLLKFAVAPPSSSQWVSMWPSLMYFVTKSGFLLGDSYWWVSNYELMVYYVKIHFELKKKIFCFSHCRLFFMYLLVVRTIVTVGEPTRAKGSADKYVGLYQCQFEHWWYLNVQ